MEEFNPLSGRDAYPAIRGFVYQVDRTILAWLDLPEGAILECEADENIDEVCRALTGSERTLVQIKYRVDPLTLRSGVVVESIAKFVATRRQTRGWICGSASSRMRPLAGSAVYGSRVA